MQLYKNTFSENNFFLFVDFYIHVDHIDSHKMKEAFCSSSTGNRQWRNARSVAKEFSVSLKFRNQSGGMLADGSVRLLEATISWKEWWMAVSRRSAAGLAKLFK